MCHMHVVSVSFLVWETITQVGFTNHNNTYIIVYINRAMNGGEGMFTVGRSCLMRLTVVQFQMIRFVH